MSDIEFFTIGVRSFFKFTTPIQLQLVALFFLLALEFMYFHRRRLPILSSRTFIGILIFSLIFIIADISVILVSRIQLPRNWGVRLASQIRLYAYLNFSLCQYLYITFLQGRRQHINVKDGIRIFSILDQRLPRLLSEPRNDKNRRSLRGAQRRGNPHP